MSEDALRDPLKDLLTAAQPAPPQRDIGFVIAVMERVERQRLQRGLLSWAAGGVVVTALMALIMPHITPALVNLGQDILPAAAVLMALGALAAGLYYLRPVLRDFGWRV